MVSTVINSASLLVRANLNESAANPYGGTFVPKIEHVLQFVAGTGADQFDQEYIDERVVASATNDDIDLSPVNTIWANRIMVNPVLLIIVNHPKSTSTPNTTTLTIGPQAVTNAWQGPWGGVSAANSIAIGPRGVFLVAAPTIAGLGAIVAGTADILRVKNSAGASATYQIGIFSRSA